MSASSAPNKRLVASLTAVLIVVILASVVAIVGRESSSDVRASVAGWCCVQKGDACMNGFQPLDCYNAEGFAFSSDENICQQACGTQL